MNAENRHTILCPEVAVSKKREGIWPFATARHVVSGLVEEKSTGRFDRHIVYDGKARNPGHAIRKATKAINENRASVKLGPLQTAKL